MHGFWGGSTIDHAVHEVWRSQSPGTSPEAGPKGKWRPGLAHPALQSGGRERRRTDHGLRLHRDRAIWSASEKSQGRHQAGQTIRAKVLWAKYIAAIMQRAVKIELVKGAELKSGRFNHHSSMLRTGTNSPSLPSNASNVLSRSFAHHYSATDSVKRQRSPRKGRRVSFELLAYRHSSTRSRASRKQATATCRLLYAADDVKTQPNTWTCRLLRRNGSTHPSPNRKRADRLSYETQDITATSFEKGLRLYYLQANPEAFQGVPGQRSRTWPTQTSFNAWKMQLCRGQGVVRDRVDGEMHTRHL